MQDLVVRLRLLHHLTDVTLFNANQLHKKDLILNSAVLYNRSGLAEITMREACRAMRYTVQPLATFISCCLMTVVTSADRDDWLATKITVAKETCSKRRGMDEG